MNNTEKIRAALDAVIDATKAEGEAQNALTAAGQALANAENRRVEAYRAAARTIHAVHGDKQLQFVIGDHLFLYSKARDDEPSLHWGKPVISL